jgi:hypothetical protein
MFKEKFGNPAIPEIIAMSVSTQETIGSKSKGGAANGI